MPPTLAVDGFEGSLDGLLALARAGKVDLARLSILALVATAFTQSTCGGDLALIRWDW